MAPTEGRVVKPEQRWGCRDEEVKYLIISRMPPSSWFRVWRLLVDHHLDVVDVLSAAVDETADLHHTRPVTSQLLALV